MSSLELLQMNSAWKREDNIKLRMDGSTEGLCKGYVILFLACNGFCGMKYAQGEGKALCRQRVLSVALEEDGKSSVQFT